VVDRAAEVRSNGLSAIPTDIVCILRSSFASGCLLRNSAKA